MLEVNTIDTKKLSLQIKTWAKELGFEQCGITDTNLKDYTSDFKEWLKLKYHGSMEYMQRNVDKRLNPEELVPRTISVIMVSINYLSDKNIARALADKDIAAISRYAVGKDYHKLIRRKLQKLALKIEAEIGQFGFRAFTDSAPVLEKPLALKAGLGWSGKNTLVLNKDIGSYFFLGTLYTDIPLPADNTKIEDLCGKCSACINVCPTNALIGPSKIDASRCISYLTIENKGSIPIEYRDAIGNRIYGCDDCQAICPHNKNATVTKELGFKARNSLLSPSLLELFNWDEEKFLKDMEGSAIRRIGYQAWIRNIAVALGNSNYSAEKIIALHKKIDSVSPMVQEHIQWAIEKLNRGKDATNTKKPSRNDRLWKKISEKL